MEDNKSSYRSIFKATSLFGGVQVYQILIQIIRGKVLAVFLGTSGVGILGLYQSAIELIKQATSFGIAQSAVRDVSEAYGTKDSARIAKTVGVVRRLVWITGSLGCFLMCILSTQLSRNAFGDSGHYFAFLLLSITLLLDQICAGQKVVLQGTRHLKYLAKASAIGVTIGLFIAIPLYYFWGINGIIPAIIFNSITSLLLTFYYSRKIKIDKFALSIKEVFAQSQIILKMGIAISLSSILSAGASYILIWFIQSKDGPSAVGLYNAGFSIMMTYVGMIFSALSTDYYPRLAASNKDNNKCREIVNSQGEIATLIITPCLLICMVFMPLVIRILYSSEFVAASSYTLWASVGMIFRLGAWLIAYQFLAKGESRLFAINETSSCIYMLGLNMLFYELLGLEGLGISYLLSYCIYFAQVLTITRLRYCYKFSSGYLKIYILSCCFIITTLIITKLNTINLVYIIGSFLILISGCFSAISLQKRIDFISLIRKIK